MLLTTHDSDGFLLLADHLTPIDIKFRYPVGRTFYQPSTVPWEEFTA